MLNTNYIAENLKDYMSAPELGAWPRVLAHVHDQTLADVPDPDPPQGG